MMNHLSVIQKICQDENLSEEEEVFFMSPCDSRELSQITEKISNDTYSIHAYSQLIWKLCSDNYISGLDCMVRRYVALDKSGISSEFEFHLMYDSLVDLCKRHKDYATNYIKINLKKDCECAVFLIGLLSCFPSEEALDMTISCIDSEDNELLSVLAHALPSYSVINKKAVLSAFNQVSNKKNLSSTTYKSLIFQLKYCKSIEAITILRAISRRSISDDITALCRTAIRSVKLRSSPFFRWLFNLNNSW